MNGQIYTLLELLIRMMEAGGQSSLRSDNLTLEGKTYAFKLERIDKQPEPKK
jgi:hypothetical protein